MMLLFTGLAWMGDAMEMMLLSFLGPSVRCEWGVGPREEGMLTSVVFVGMMFGAPTWGILADWKGRRIAFFATTAITFFAGLMSAFSPTFGFLLFARGLVGFGLGGVPVAYSMFMEFLPSDGRGVWLTVIEVFWTLGSMIEAGLAWAILPHYSWRVLLAASTLPLALLLALMWFVPESPYYTASKGDAAATNRILRRICAVNGGGAALPPGMLTTTTTTTTGGGESGEANQPWWRRALKPFAGVGRLLDPGMRTTTLMLWFIFLAIAFMYYGVVLLTTEVHLDTSDGRSDNKEGGSRGGSDTLACTNHGSPDLSGKAYGDIFVSSTAELPGLMLAAVFVDRLGRRRTMGGSLLLNFVCTLPLVAYAAMPAWLETASLFAARGSIMSAFTVLYIYAPEVYPTSVRATAMGIGNGFARLGGMTCPLFAVEMVEGGNLAAAVGFFAALALVTAVLAFWLPVETAGKKLDCDDDGGGGGGGGGGSGGVGSSRAGNAKEGSSKVGDVELSSAARGVAFSPLR
jgi:MFS family permease